MKILCWSASYFTWYVASRERTCVAIGLHGYMRKHDLPRYIHATPRLSVLAALFQRRSQVLRRHEVKLLCHVSLYYFGLYNESFGDVAQRRRHDINRGECPWENHASVCPTEYLDRRWYDGVYLTCHPACAPTITHECILTPVEISYTPSQIPLVCRSI